VIMIGIDAHKRTHTAVAIDEVGRELAIRTVAATSSGHLALLRWAAEIAEERSWAVEDCRHLSRHLERDLLASGERILRVPPKMMANARDSARTYGKSDPIDALAVARAALREPDLSVAYLDGPARDLRLLVDHREALVAERTRRINRLRWHLHELQPGWDPPARTLGRARGLTELQAKLRCHSGTVVELASELVEDIAGLSERIAVLEGKIAAMVAPLAPALLAIVGCGALTAAKIIGEVGGASRFRSRDAFARHNGTAPVPCWSGARAGQVRLSRVGNRQLNRAIHTIALTQARRHPDARRFLERRAAKNDPRRSAIRALKRRLSDVVYRALIEDEPTAFRIPSIAA
jgi:transposase